MDPDLFRGRETRAEGVSLAILPAVLSAARIDICPIAQIPMVREIETR
jgi:hypothetical protein